MEVNDLSMKFGHIKSRHKPRKLGIGIVLSLLVVTTTACLEAVPSDSIPDAPVATDAPDTTIGFRDPSAPVVNPGSGLPDFESDTTGITDEEIDCDNAEDLCDSGAWACDDIADYCDIGPDDGSELPDDWDWDQ
jgi:hypothetical protein